MSNICSKKNGLYHPEEVSDRICKIMLGKARNLKAVILLDRLSIKGTKSKTCERCGSKLLDWFV